MKPRQLHLLLSLANFSTGLGAFAVIGVLSPIATGVKVSIADAGLLMSLYALTYAIASPLSIAATGRFDRARVLVAGLTVLATASALAALAPSYPTLCAARAAMALGAGLVTPVTASIGIASVPAEDRGRALATVYGGLTLAQAVGVPLGAWMGYAVSWRFTFVMIAVSAGVAALVLARVAPRGIVVPPTSLRALRDALCTPRLVVAVAFIVLLMGGVFAVYTYLGALLEARHALGKTGVSVVFLVFGFGAVIGNSLGGRLTDRIGAVPTLVLLCLAQIVLMPLLTLTHTHVIVTTLLVGVWSVAGWSVNVAQQARLATLDPGKAPVLMALHAAAIYLGTYAGSAMGGSVIERAGHAALGPTGAIFAALALASLGLSNLIGRPAAAASLAE